MTLDEAIEHAEWCARESQGECAEEHRQLAEWLRELKRLKFQNKRLRRWCTALRENQKKAFAESCKTATNSMGQIGTLRDKNAELRNENEKLRELVRDLYDAAWYEYPSAFEATYAKRLKELGIEVDV